MILRDILSCGWAQIRVNNCLARQSTVTSPYCRFEGLALLCIHRILPRAIQTRYKLLRHFIAMVPRLGCLRDIVEQPSEEEHVWLGLVDFIVFPAKTLQNPESA